MGWLKRIKAEDEANRQRDAERAEHAAHAQPHIPAQAKPTAAKTTAGRPAPAKAAATKTTAATRTTTAAKTTAAKTTAAPARTTTPARSTAAARSAPPASKATSTARTAPGTARPAGTSVTPRHDQALTLHVLTHVPEHAPRSDDPHYHLFEMAKARLKRQGLWKCMIGDDLCEGPPELHHTWVEFSEINEVDEHKIEQSLGLHFDTDEDFQNWVESPGNLEVLCANHHRSHYGIHVIPGPLWEALRFRKRGTQAAAEFIPGSQAQPGM
jgi:hypothetical protein